MTILIKNITNTRSNACAIAELEREGYPEGSVIEDARYTPSNNACYWNNCVAYIGETCEVLNPNS
ncbi:MAG: hypothetical protein LBF81_05305 [Prevotellaceae bacterium]|jgi:hypothetical protein|nr:hypothetical protein [Prevotellaceae bacterium]